MNRLSQSSSSDSLSSFDSGFGGWGEDATIMHNPYEAIMWFSHFSPILIATCITSLSFVFQNFKGLIYLAYLIAVCVLRSFCYSMANVPVDSKTKSNSKCDKMQYSTYSNSTFSAFVFAFTLMYLSYPMFSNGTVNYWVFISLLIYFFIDIFIKMYNECIPKIHDLVLNVLMGAASSALIITLMYTGGSSQFLFFNEMSSNKEMCSQPSKQTFRCSVFKNGELVSEL